MRYLFRSKRAVPVYKGLVVGFVFLGSLFQSGLVWALSDVCNGLMVLPNLAALLLLFPTVLAMSREDRSHPLRGYARERAAAEEKDAGYRSGERRKRTSEKDERRPFPGSYGP